MEQPASSRRVYLLGALRIHDAHGLRRLSGPKSQRLLAYLVLSPLAPQRREMLAELLSPDAPPDRVRRTFSDTLYRLQKTLGAEWLAIDNDTVALRAGSLWVDVWEFERLAASEQAAELQQAVDLYSGDLLPELYDDWILAERELRRNHFLATLERLAAQREAQGDLQRALLTTRRLILAEPLHEAAHRAYLRLLGRLGRPGEALAHYDYVCRFLAAELGAEPPAETRALVEAIERERDVAAAPAVAHERTAFVGRRGERAAALASVEAAVGGRGGMLAVEGEAGIGKSRLLREVMAGASWRGATVVYGAAGEIPDASPFAPLAEALAPLLNGSRAAQLETLLAAESLAAVAPLYPAWRERAALPELPGEQARARFHGALRLFITALARLRPLVLALDDLQWASAALWDSLSVLAPCFTGHGALLLLAYRRSEIEATPGWDILQAWDRAATLITLSLDALSVQEVAQLIGAGAPGDPAEIQALTGGNPFLIGEWLADSTLERPERRYTAAHRLRVLTPSARAALECAAVLGERVAYRMWSELAALPPLVHAGISEELAAQRWLEPSAAGYNFAHDLIRTAVYDAIDGARRRELHRRAALVYAELDPQNARARAFHLDRAGLQAEAAGVYREAGEQYLAQFAFREAQSALDRALALMAPFPTVERVETALALARACETTGDRARQRPALDEALAGARRLEDDALVLEALLVLGNADIQTVRIADAQVHLNAALVLARQLPDRRRETYAVFLLGDVAVQQGKLSDAQQRFSQALELARASSDQQYEGRALRGLGLVTRQMGLPHQSLDWLEQALAIHSHMEDRWSEVVTRTILLGTLFELGAWDRLLATAEDVLGAAEALGDHNRVAGALHLQGLASYALGEYDDAWQRLSRAEQAFEARGQRRMAGLLRNTLGLVAEDEGRYGEALGLYRAALANAQALQAEVEAAYAQHDLGALLVRIGQESEAVPLLEAARAKWIEHGNLLLRLKSEAFLGLALLPAGERSRANELAAGGWAAFQDGVPVGEQPQGWLWALYGLLTALQQDEPAHAVLRAAYAELQRQAGAIGDAARRSGFFERVPLNRAIVAAHDALTASSRVTLVSLARRDAPLGRTLRADEYVAVRWTVEAPEDEAIPDKAERRRQRLLRLLREAEQADAAPTDDDLARALGVSRRTILRDMQVVTPPRAVASTRKRKA